MSQSVRVDKRRIAFSTARFTRARRTRQARRTLRARLWRRTPGAQQPAVDLGHSHVLTATAGTLPQLHCAPRKRNPASYPQHGGAWGGNGARGRARPPVGRPSRRETRSEPMRQGRAAAAHHGAPYARDRAIAGSHRPTGPQARRHRCAGSMEPGAWGAAAAGDGVRTFCKLSLQKQGGCPIFCLPVATCPGSSVPARTSFYTGPPKTVHGLTSQASTLVCCLVGPISCRDWSHRKQPPTATCGERSGFERHGGDPGRSRPNKPRIKPGITTPSVPHPQ